MAQKKTTRSKTCYSAPARKALKYIDDVRLGRITTGKYIKLAVKRHLKDLKTASKRGLYFDEGAPEYVYAFFTHLRHSKGEWAGQIFELQPWQAFVIWVLFGWKVKATGYRRFREAHVSVGRKNGKSTLAAAIGLYLFMGDMEPGAEVYTAATKRDQAKIVHEESIRMLKSSPELRQFVDIFKNNISMPSNNAKYEPLGKDSETLDGLNPHAAIIDELHAHKDRLLYDVLDTATGARRQPMLFTITTAGIDKKLICGEQYEYGLKILNSILKDDTFFAYIAELDVKDDWMDPKNWAKGNPNLGVSIKKKELEERFKKAKESPSAQNAFRRLRLNQWTKQTVRWLSLDKWDACAFKVDPEALRGRICYAGLDLANSIDIASLVLVFPPEKEKGRYEILPFFWIPEENMQERSRRDRVTYERWVERGLIIATPGNVIDYDSIKRSIYRVDEGQELEPLNEKYNIVQMAFDRWGAVQISQELDKAGLEVVAFGQGFKDMSPPTRELLKLVIGRQLAHGGNEVLRWMADNMVVRSDPSANVKPDKKQSIDKIDGMVAMIMGLALATIGGGPEESVYEDRGLVVI